MTRGEPFIQLNGAGHGPAPGGHGRPPHGPSHPAPFLHKGGEDRFADNSYDRCPREKFGRRGVPPHVPMPPAAVRPHDRHRGDYHEDNHDRQLRVHRNSLRRDYSPDRNAQLLGPRETRHVNSIDDGIQTEQDARRKLESYITVRLEPEGLNEHGEGIPLWRTAKVFWADEIDPYHTFLRIMRLNQDDYAKNIDLLQKKSGLDSPIQRQIEIAARQLETEDEDAKCRFTYTLEQFEVYERRAAVTEPMVYRQFEDTSRDKSRSKKHKHRHRSSGSGSGSSRNRSHKHHKEKRRKERVAVHAYYKRSPKPGQPCLRILEEIEHNASYDRSGDEDYDRDYPSNRRHDGRHERLGDRHFFVQHHRRFNGERRRDDGRYSPDHHGRGTRSPSPYGSDAWTDVTESPRMPPQEPLLLDRPPRHAPGQQYQPHPHPHPQPPRVPAGGPVRPPPGANRPQMLPLQQPGNHGGQGGPPSFGAPRGPDGPPDPRGFGPGGPSGMDAPRGGFGLGGPGGPEGPEGPRGFGPNGPNGPGGPGGPGGNQPPPHPTATAPRMPPNGPGGAGGAAAPYPPANMPNGPPITGQPGPNGRGAPPGTHPAMPAGQQGPPVTSRVPPPPPGHPAAGPRSNIPGGPNGPPPPPPPPPGGVSQAPTRGGPPPPGPPGHPQAGGAPRPAGQPPVTMLPPQVRSAGPPAPQLPRQGGVKPTVKIAPPQVVGRKSSRSSLKHPKRGSPSSNSSDSDDSSVGSYATPDTDTFDSDSDGGPRPRNRSLSRKASFKDNYKPGDFGVRPQPSRQHSKPVIVERGRQGRASSRGRYISPEPPRPSSHVRGHSPTRRYSDGDAPSTQTLRLERENSEMRERLARLELRDEDRRRRENAELERERDRRGDPYRRSSMEYVVRDAEMARKPDVNVRYVDASLPRRDDYILNDGRSFRPAKDDVYTVKEKERIYKTDPYPTTESKPRTYHEARLGRH